MRKIIHKAAGSRLTAPIVATILAIFLTYFLTSDVTSDAVMNLVCGSSDVEVSDFYNRVRAGGSKKRIDDNIVIINVDSVFNRGELAALIEEVNGAKPKAMALDLLFDEEGDAEEDAMLTGALAAAPDIVVGQAYNDWDMAPQEDFISRKLPQAKRGMVNLTSASRHAIVRNFTPYFGESREYPGLAVAMLHGIEPTAVSSIPSGEEEMIRFQPREFYVASPGEVAATPDIVKDKIVIFGTVNEEADLHPTPLGDDFPGVMIHANTLSMMMDGDYTSPASKWINFLLALICCLAVSWLYVRLDDTQNLALRLFPIFWMVAVVIFGCWSFNEFGLYVDAPSTILLGAISMLLLDLWFALRKPLSRIRLFKLNRALIVIAAISFATLSAGARELKVYEITGKVERQEKQKWTPLEKSARLAETDLVRIAPASRIRVVDTGTRFVYSFGEKGEFRLSDILARCDKDNKNLVSKLSAEVRNNAAPSSRHKALGAAHRALDEEMLEALYASLCEALPLNREAGNLSLTKREEGEGLYILSLSNHGEEPLHIGLFALTPGNYWQSLPIGDEDTGTLMLLPQSQLTLTDLPVMLEAADRLVAVGIDRPFDTKELDYMFEEGFEPAESMMEDIHISFAK